GYLAERAKHRRALCNDETVMTGGEYTCGRRHRRDRKHRRVNNLRAVGAQWVFERRPAAEQGQARTDFDQQRIAAAQGDVAAEPVSPGGETAQQMSFGGAITRACLQARAQRACGREWLIEMHALALSLLIGEN